MLTAAFCSSAMNGIVRYVSAEVHPFEIAFFRNVFGFVALLPLFARAGLTPLRTRRIGLHAVRGLFNAVAMLTFFWGVSLTPLAKVAALNFTSPLFATLGTILVLKEAMGLQRWIGLVIGFMGALVILQPGVDQVSLGAVLVLVSSATWACALVVIKILGRTESSLTSTTYATFFLTPACLLAALPVWTWPNLEQLGLLAAIGALGSGGQMAVAQAFREADATVVLPLDFTKLIWASVIGYVVFLEVPDLGTWMGGAIIFSSVTYIAYREARQPDRLPGPKG